MGSRESRGRAHRGNGTLATRSVTARPGLLRSAVLAVSVVLMAVELWFAPLVLVITLVALLGAAWWIRSRIQSSRDRRAAIGRELQIGVLLLVGLWVGVYLVLRLADSNVDSQIGSSVPISFTGESASAAALLLHGLLSTAACAAFVGAVRRIRDHRRRTGATRGSRRTRSSPAPYKDS